MDCAVLRAHEALRGDALLALHGCLPQAVRELQSFLEKVCMGFSLEHRLQSQLGMSSKRSLQLILAISLFGVAFSGQLSIRELTGAIATVCPSPGAPGTVFGYPACIYGLLMYTLIAGLSAWGLLSQRRESASAAARLTGRRPSSQSLSQELHS